MGDRRGRYTQYKEPGEGVPPSWVAKAHGVGSLQELMLLTSYTKYHINRLYHQKPEAFVALCKMAANMKKRN